MISIPLAFSLSLVAAAQGQSESVCAKLQGFYQATCSPGVEETLSIAVQGPPGKRGARGEKGDRGSPGRTGVSAEIDYGRVESIVSGIFAEDFMTVGSIAQPASSCNEINRVSPGADNGLYYLRDTEETYLHQEYFSLKANVFQTYCDFNVAGGGWTLVASVHENNMKGRCTAGDRWSSEQGNGAGHPDGDGFWENRATYGSATSAASDDYKNSGYFAMNGTDVMIWQVPNDTPLTDFAARAFLKYRTSNGFMTRFGGNLASLFSLHYNIKSKQYRTNLDNGPAIPITWEVGSNQELMNLYGSSIRGEVDAGYIQFRAVNHERDAFAMCPGVKIKTGKGNIEHACVGSTSNSPTLTHCGDYAWRDIDDQRWIAYRLNQRMIDSVVMIFYR